MTQLPVIEQFGEYKLHKKIGEGGMAEVFLATADNHEPGAPPVVIKRLHERLENDRDAVDLFLTEADVTMMLTHPNVIKVYDCGDVGNRYYIAMEYVHGKDLEQLWERARQKRVVLDSFVVAQIMAEVLRGLQYVHDAKTPSGRDLGIVPDDLVNTGKRGFH